MTNQSKSMKSVFGLLAIGLTCVPLACSAGSGEDQGVEHASSDASGLHVEATRYSDGHVIGVVSRAGDTVSTADLDATLKGPMELNTLAKRVTVDVSGNKDLESEANALGAAYLAATRPGNPAATSTPGLSHIQASMCSGGLFPCCSDGICTYCIDGAISCIFPYVL